MIRRGLVAVAALLAVLAQVAIGLVGPTGHVCVCATCITLERADADCGSATPAAAIERDRSPGLVVLGDGGCSDCHLVPLPDTTYLPTAAAPAHPVAADLPAIWPLVAQIVWPPSPAMRMPRSDRQRTPGDLHRRLLRSVVLTC